MHADFADLISVIGYSALQSSLSSLITIALGFLVALGFAPLQNSPKKRALELLLLAPGLLPSLIVIVSSLDFISFFGRFPFGFWGVILVHVFMNTGLATVTISRSIERETASMIELATIDGVQKSTLIPLVFREIRPHLRGLFIFLFVLCFTSFSAPMIVGAQTGRTIESLIAAALASGSSRTLPLLFGGLQVAIVSALAYGLRPKWPMASQNQPHPRLLDRISVRSIFALWIGLTSALFLSLVVSFKRGLADFFSNSILIARSRDLVVGTLIEATIVGLVTVVILSSIGFLSPRIRTNNFLLMLSIPSWATVGFLLAITFDLALWPYLSVLSLISIAFAILIFSSLYRLRFAHSLREIASQVDEAQIMGARRFERFRFIVWPMIRKDVGFLAGLAALWASCDFAFSSLVAGRELTIGIVAHNLLTGYRTEVATVVSLIAFAVGSILFVTFHHLLSPKEVG
jgi:thiamine transport system permease protein